jgi:hypothetical protein
MSVIVYPLNDLPFVARLKDIDTNPLSSTFGRAIDLTTGTVSAFIATSILPTATAADPSFTTTGQHIGKGKWLFVFDGSILLPAVLNTLFGSGTPPQIIIQQPGNIRSYIPNVTYLASKPALVG